MAHPDHESAITALHSFLSSLAARWFDRLRRVPWEAGADRGWRLL